MKSFPAVGAVSAISAILAACTAPGQIFPTGAPVLQVAPTYPPVGYFRPAAAPVNGNSWSYPPTPLIVPGYPLPVPYAAQPVAWGVVPPTSYLRPSGFSTLVSQPALNSPAPEPVPAIAPQAQPMRAPMVAPSPSDMPQQYGLGYSTPGYGTPTLASPTPSQPQQAIGPSYAAPGSCAPAPSYWTPPPDYASASPYGANGCGATCGTPGTPYTGDCSQGTGQGYGVYGLGGGVGGYPWFAVGYGLLMSRDDENPYLFSYDTGWESIQLTNSRDANFNTAGGYEIHIGRYFNCGMSAAEFVYWSILPGTNTAETTNHALAGNLDGILNWDDLTYNGRNADAWVNNAQSHMVSHHNEFYNLEINFLCLCGACPPDPCGYSPFRCHWLFGARYFNFRDELVFGADTVDHNFTNALEELYYRIATDNNLIGLQWGAGGEYAVTCRLAVDCGVKMGLYQNHIVHHSYIGGSAGTAVINNGPNAGRTFVVDNSENEWAGLGELNLGLQYRLTCNCTATLGYRVLAATGVALPTEQIYPDLRGIQDVEDIDSNGSLLLHGAYAGLICNF